MEISPELLALIEVPDFTTLTYLRHGNPRQKQAFQFLEECRLFDHLKALDPVLAGTIPLGIDIPGSDLDVLCYSEELPSELHDILPDSFVKKWKWRKFDAKFPDQLNARVFLIESSPFPIEIFIQPVPSIQQRAFRHLLAEARLLKIDGPEAVAAIIDLKQNGLKTEPAFAKYFGISGDPTISLLKFSGD